LDRAAPGENGHSCSSVRTERTPPRHQRPGHDAEEHPLQPWVTPSYPTGFAPPARVPKGHGAPLGRFPMSLENSFQDLRYGVPMLRRNPLFAGAAVITL